MAFAIKAITYALGERSIDIARELPAFAPVISKTGISTVHETDGTSLDLAEKSLGALLDQHPRLRQDVNALIVVSQSPTNFLPSAACSLQHRCGITEKVLAFDLGQGCSGFVQALMIGDGLLKSHENVILVCTDTYRQKLRDDDRSTAAVFSDASSAIWLTRRPDWSVVAQSHFTNGSGANHLIHRVPKGIAREYLHMSGADVFLFTKNVVPAIVRSILAEAHLSVSDIQDWYFHQASKLVLDSLKESIGIKVALRSNLSRVGNTTSSSIPILMSESLISMANMVCLCGFGVGLSCSAVILTRNQSSSASLS